MNKKREAAVFVFLCIGISWVCWIPLVLAYRSGISELGEMSAITLVLWLLGSWMPSLVALSMTWQRDGYAGIKIIGKNLVAQNRRLGGYLVALGIPTLIWVFALLLVVRDPEFTLPIIDPGRWMFIPIGFLAAIPFGPLGEEMGWRGYLQPRLLSESNSVLTGIIIGVIWTAWHIPLFWAPAGTTLSGSEVTISGVAGYGVVLIVLSVVLAKLSQHYGPTLLFALLLHTAWNSQPIRFLFAPVSDEIAGAMSAIEPIVVLAVAILSCILFWAWKFRTMAK